MVKVFLEPKLYRRYRFHQSKICPKRCSRKSGGPLRLRP
jgi:hypothetical protein